LPGSAHVPDSRLPLVYLSAPMKTIRTLAVVTAVFAYALIVLGAVVRITGSGLGCGPSWPLCNGRLVPSLGDYHTVIEYIHRLAALGLMLLTASLAISGFAHRKAPGVGGPGGIGRPIVISVALLALQVMLGAIAVWLDLHASAVVLHLGNAMALLATLLVVGLRAKRGERGEVRSWERASPLSPLPTHGNAAPRLARGAVAALALAGTAILLGGLTATTGAAPACLGFPLCNGQIWPGAGAGGRALLHWIHRLVAYVLFLHMIGMANRAHRLGSSPTRNWAWIAAGCVTLQLAVAALMVLNFLPPSLRALHVAVGTAAWVTLVYFTWHATRTVAPDAAWRDVTLSARRSAPAGAPPESPRGRRRGAPR